MSKYFGFFILFLLFFLFPRQTKAALVEINKGGEVSVNVLSFDSESALVYDSDLQIKQVAKEGVDENSVIALDKKDGRVSLMIGNSKSFDVTNWEDSLIEIEERPKSKMIQVSKTGDDFIISQNNFRGITPFPISINPVDNNFTLKTENGMKGLNLLPFEIAQSALRSNLVSRLGPNPFKIVETDGEIFYLVEGEKIVSIANVYDFKLPVTTRLSATTGEIVAIEDPSWLKFISVIFI